jgi:Arc/MetJ-type ribon-helix-helix transcriptional regulator
MEQGTAITVVLDQAEADWIRGKVRDGSFASETDVVKHGIEALREDDSELEAWLHNVGGQIYDRMRADPSRGIPAEEVLRRTEERRLLSKKSA